MLWSASSPVSISSSLPAQDLPLLASPNLATLSLVCRRNCLYCTNRPLCGLNLPPLSTRKVISRPQELHTLDFSSSIFALGSSASRIVFTASSSPRWRRLPQSSPCMNCPVSPRALNAVATPLDLNRPTVFVTCPAHCFRRVSATRHSVCYPTLSLVGTMIRAIGVVFCSVSLPVAVDLLYTS